MSEKSASMHDGFLVITIAVLTLVLGFIARLLFNSH